ncbi:MAG: glycosyltransferase family 4 protein [candidate division KSB1 bacterium]|nr:glycosyltransferase family 4 protein [candidate division KSB1 bacterium]MDZ7379333.1 glycosyltransferase family 4 protein [candidate division KSB1 bacterium]MDZ7385362.1 glycosyltransferase family 4 protein [candidate division KSB1 bacterium]MDZ7393506.1 glycosyltransferase family 4 protein [candidate division KSB1 bacterium]
MRLRILLINWQDIRHPSHGGAEVHAHEILRRMAAAGHEVTQVSCAFHGGAREEVIDGVRIFRRGPRPVFNYLVPFLYRTLKDREAFDIVLEDINKIPFYTPLYVRRPVVAIVHHLFGSAIRLETGRLAAAYVQVAEKLVPRVYRDTRFVAVSASTQRELASLGLRCSSEDIAYNAVDHEVCYPRPELKSQRATVGYLGRIKRYKCLDHLLLALPMIQRAIPEVRLLVVGEGDDRPRLEAMAREMGISERVQFTGQVTEQQKAELLNQMWVMVNPSAKEGWGITVLEASACGVPVVAADSPGLRDSVVHGRTGLLYPWGDLKGLTECVCSVLKNKQLRERLGQAGHLWAQRFSWESSVSRLMEIIEQEMTRSLRGGNLHE